MGEIRIELEREEDGRWIAEIAAVPGVMAYGLSEAQLRGTGWHVACAENLKGCR